MDNRLSEIGESPMALNDILISDELQACFDHENARYGKNMNINDFSEARRNLQATLMTKYPHVPWQFYWNIELNGHNYQQLFNHFVLGEKTGGHLLLWNQKEKVPTIGVTLN
jgi:hypothetical protein